MVNIHNNIIFIYTYTLVYVKYNNYIFQLLEIYISLAAVSDCQSKLYAIQLFWFG